MRNAIGYAVTKATGLLNAESRVTGAVCGFRQSPSMSQVKRWEWQLRSLLDNAIVRYKLARLQVRYQHYSMVPKPIFIENLYLCHRLARHVEGSVVECGVWRGGISAAMTHVLGAHRKYYLFDSFEGLPPAKEIDGKAALAWQHDITSPTYFDNCRAGIESAERAMSMSAAKDYRLIRGWFSETLPSFVPGEPIAVLRLDADWYDSTTECLNRLYRYVAKGGLVLIDDYYTWDGCSRAVHDFLSATKSEDRIRQSTNGVCYIVKR